MSKKECKFCKETSCIVSHEVNVNNIKGIDKVASLVRADIRPEDNLFQIDVQTLYTNNEGKVMGSFSDDCLDINYCPVCGRKLRKDDSEIEVEKIVEEIKRDIDKVFNEQEDATKKLIKKMFWKGDDDCKLSEELTKIREKTKKDLIYIQQVFASKMNEVNQVKETFDEALAEVFLHIKAKSLDKELNIQEEKEKNYDCTDNTNNQI